MLVAVKRHDERKCQWCCWSVWRRCNAITWWMNISPKLNSPPCPWSPPPAPEWSAAPCGLAWELSSMSLRRGLCDPDIFSWGVGWSERWDWCRGVDEKCNRGYDDVLGKWLRPREAEHRIVPASPCGMTAFLLLACLRYSGFTSSSQGTQMKATSRRMVCTLPWPAYMGSSTAPVTE